MLIEYAWLVLPGAVDDEGRMKMLMFLELSEASLYLPCVAGGIICCLIHVVLHLIAPTRPKVAGFLLNLSTDVTSCCCTMILMNTCASLPDDAGQQLYFLQRLFVWCRCFSSALPFHTRLPATWAGPAEAKSHRVQRTHYRVPSSPLHHPLLLFLISARVHCAAIPPSGLA